MVQCGRQALLHRRTWAVVWGMVLFGLAGPSGAQTRSVTGQSGILGEWELTATVAEQGDGAGRQWTGPLSLKHVGFCSADGPEEKTGELRLSVSDSAGRGDRDADDRGDRPARSVDASGKPMTAS